LNLPPAAPAVDAAETASNYFHRQSNFRATLKTHLSPTFESWSGARAVSPLVTTAERFADRVQEFILFHGNRHPGELVVSEVGRFLDHLARSGLALAGVRSPHASNVHLAPFLG
jgi:hypothetical protein